MVDSEVLERLRLYDIHPNERLGQHILIDSDWLEYIAGHADPSAHVIEIGAGPGNLTERIAARASSVTAIELDPQYECILSDVSQQYPNVSVVFGDALSVDYEALRSDRYQELQIIANPPYHIAEPLMGILTTLPLQDAILMVGNKLSAALNETDPKSTDFSRLSLLAMGFFEVEILAEIPKSAFYPPPRTESHIIRLLPKEESESAGTVIHIIRQLFLLADQTSVGNIIHTALQSGGDGQQLRSKKDRNRHARRETQRRLDEIMDIYNIYGEMPIDSQGGDIYTNPRASLDIPEHILSKRFFGLPNDQLRILAQAILDAYSN